MDMSLPCFMCFTFIFTFLFVNDLCSPFSLLTWFISKCNLAQNGLIKWNEYVYMYLCITSITTVITSSFYFTPFQTLATEGCS